MAGRIRTVVWSALVLALVACQPTFNVGFTGKSHADERLRQDTLRLVSLFVARKGCDSIEHVDSSVLFYEPTNGEPNHVWGKEGWMVTGCSTPYPFFITFTEDGQGGTFVGVTQSNANR